LPEKLHAIKVAELSPKSAELFLHGLISRML
jgi:hypothetical protein